MSIIQSLKDYFAEYSGITGTNHPILTDFLGSLPTQYSIVPLAGARVLEGYLDGSATMTFPFAFQAMKYRADEVERMQNNDFFQELAEWLDEQTENGILPTMDDGKTAESIEALDWAFLLQEGQSETGVYQIQCLLAFKQD